MQAESSKTPFIVNRKKLFIGLGLFLLAAVLQIKYPHQQPIINELLAFAHLPTYSNNKEQLGLHIGGVLLMAITIMALYTLVQSMSRNKVLSFIAGIIILPFVSVGLLTGYQVVFAQGIYALQPSHQSLFCQYKVRDGLYNGTCRLRMNNFSSKAVTVLPIIEQDTIRSVPSAPKLPVAAADPITIAPWEKQTVEITFEQSVSDSEMNMGGSGSTALRLSLVDEHGRKRQIS